MNIARSEKVAAYSHAATMPVFLFGTIFLLISGSGNIGLQLASLVYGMSGVFLFSSSFLYHATKRGENMDTLWRKFDHTAIFFLIAGTYTPLCFLYLDGPMKWSILGAQWSLVIAGTVFKFIFITAPRFIGTLIYLVMGWIVIIPIVTLVHQMPRQALALMISGGVMYTIGAIIYGFKWPDPRPGFFGFHEIFHFLVSAGAVMHFATILFGIRYAVH